MSIPNRIYRIGKAYLNQVKDRIESWDAEMAEKELQGPADTPPGERPLPARDDTSAEAMMRRAEERIRRSRDEVTARSEVSGRTEDAAAATDPNLADYVILGVPTGADWSTVQAAYEKLARRCDPRRFPEGSTEQKEAQRILERVNTAYEALRKRLDPTESRFGKLEF